MGYVHQGTTRGYRWVVLQHGVLQRHSPSRKSDTLNFEWQDLVPFHPGRFIYLTCFDGDPVTGGSVSNWLGWSRQGRVAVSPPIDSSTKVPLEHETECYVWSDPSIDMEKTNVFAIEPGFTLVPPEHLYEHFDDTWERSGLDFLVELQERFWAQIDRLQPETYLAIGENEIVVSRNQAFMAHVLASIA